MRRDDHVRRLEQRPGVRLGREDVDRGARHLARLERLDERRLVDELAARGVHDAHAVLHPRDRGRRRSMPRVSSFSGRWSVMKSARSSTPSKVSLSTPSSRKRSARDERVVGDDAHLEADGAARDLLPDPPEAEHAERLLGKLDASPARALPAALLQRRVRLRDVARERDRRDRPCARPPRRCSTRARSRRRCPRRVAASTSTLSTPTPARPITFRLSARAIRSAVSFVADADHDRVVPVDDLREVALSVDVDVEARAQQLDAGLGDLLADENSRARADSRSGAGQAGACALGRLRRAYAVHGRNGTWPAEAVEQEAILRQ